MCRIIPLFQQKLLTNKFLIIILKNKFIKLEYYSGNLKITIDSTTITNECTIISVKSNLDHETWRIMIHIFVILSTILIPLWPLCPFILPKKGNLARDHEPNLSLTLQVRSSTTKIKPESKSVSPVQTVVTTTYCMIDLFTKDIVVDLLFLLAKMQSKKHKNNEKLRIMIHQLRLFTYVAFWLKGNMYFCLI